jgi:hypothetical protein
MATQCVHIIYLHFEYWGVGDSSSFWCQAFQYHNCLSFPPLHMNEYFGDVAFFPAFLPPTISFRPTIHNLHNLSRCWPMHRVTSFHSSQPLTAKIHTTTTMASSRKARNATTPTAFAAVLVTPGTETKFSSSSLEEPEHHRTEAIPSGRRHCHRESDGASNPQLNTSVGSPRRVLFRDDGFDRRASCRSTKSLAVPVAPSQHSLVTNQKKRLVSPGDDDEEADYHQRAIIAEHQHRSGAKRRLLFGRYVTSIECAPNVQAVYKIIRKLTGHIGGNGYSGPIYGELTMHSMQKMINLMMETAHLNKHSRFLDVGSGIGKPNLHVAQHPGVAFSCGVEMEHTRWALGMSCLNACLEEAVRQRKEVDIPLSGATNASFFIQGNTMFLHKNVTEAKTFDPFTHVYMFSIGFPPDLWIRLSEQWNKSDHTTCQYLICYHGPKDIVDCYAFEVELVAQTSTSMHGSKEGHMGYIYRRKACATAKNMSTLSTPPWCVVSSKTTVVACDPLYESSFELVQEGLQSLHHVINSQVHDLMGGDGRTTRSRQLQRLTRY